MRGNEQKKTRGFGRVSTYTYEDERLASPPPSSYSSHHTWDIIVLFVCKCYFGMRSSKIVHLRIYVNDCTSFIICLHRPEKEKPQTTPLDSPTVSIWRLFNERSILTRSPFFLFGTFCELELGKISLTVAILPFVQVFLLPFFFFFFG